MTEPLLTTSDRVQLGACALGILLFGCGWLFLLADDWATRQKDAWPVRAPFLAVALLVILALSFTAAQEALRGL